MEKYNTESSIIPVNILYFMVKQGNIDINPPYQREVIWSEQKKSYYIDSLYKGIIASILLLNTDQETGKKICIDGKQRISSIYEYIENKIPLIIKDDDEEIHVYYNKTPKEKKNNITYRVMSQEEKNKQFDNINIRVVNFIDLNYMDQINIFTRIQNAVELSNGEKIGALLKDVEDCNFLKDFCDKTKKIFDGYDGIETHRKKHVEIITNTIYMVDKKQIPNNIKREQYLKQFGKNERISPKILNIKSTLKKSFSDELLKNEKINKPILINLMYCTIFFVHNNKNINNDKIIHTINTLNNKYNRNTKIKKPQFNELCDQFENIYNITDIKNIKNNTKSTNTKNKQIICSSDDNSSDSSSDVNSDEYNSNDENSQNDSDDNNYNNKTKIDVPHINKKINIKTDKNKKTYYKNNY